MEVKTGKRSDCPFSCSLDIWGDKWSLLIIRNIMFYHANTYGEFLKAPEKIATNILADRLASLEAAGLITKHAHPGSKAKTLYKLTAMGISLLPVMVEISIWAEQHFDISPAVKKIMAVAKKDKEGFIKAMQAELVKANL